LYAYNLDMPKQTFLNLTDKKRNQLVATALKEFADRDYNTASVSKIVERAGIAKGSFYQYFKDKQDLYLYLVAIASQKMLDFIAQTPPPDPDADFFETLRWQMAASVKVAVKFPMHSKLLRRAYSSPLPFRDRLLEKAKEIREDHFHTMVASA
jgi:TetR/AcrR family transcriptional regulator